MIILVIGTKVKVVKIIQSYTDIVNRTVLGKVEK